MATLESKDSNILDAEEFNWRLIVYPVLVIFILVAGGFGYYYYQLSEREQLESVARETALKATTPQDMLKVADQFPGTDQATLALLNAGKDMFDGRDYAGAISTYQRVIGTAAIDPQLRDSAELGLASALEATGKNDDAITSYLVVAREAAKSPFAPYAYNSAARIYDQLGDKENERKILTEATTLAPDSPFVKQAQYKLKELGSSPGQGIPENLAPSTAKP